MGFERGEWYCRIECDLEDCPEWQRLLDPKLLPDALLAAVQGGWVVVKTGSTLRTYCGPEHWAEAIKYDVKEGG